MVGVPVVAPVVVAHQHVGVLAVQDSGQPTGDLVRACLVDRRLVQAQRIAVLLPAGHPGVAVLQPVDALDAQDARGRTGLAAAMLDQVAVVPQMLGTLAVIAVGGEHGDHPVPLAGGQRHHPGGLGRLVIGVGVEKHDRRHPDSVPCRPPCALSLARPDAPPASGRTPPRW